MKPVSLNQYPKNLNRRKRWGRANSLPLLNLAAHYVSGSQAFTPRADTNSCLALRPAASESFIH